MQNGHPVWCPFCTLSIASFVGQAGTFGQANYAASKGDVSAGHSISDNLKISANVINVTNHRVLLDNSVTIGGFHYNDPRMLSAELRYRFHF